ncbi:MAG TPA: hypothetical protein VGM29_19370 [Polyangiaceae bacterium]|jgi:hypothetical protein
MDRFVIVIPMLVSLLIGCKDQAQCEKERNELYKTWGGLRAEATHRKLEGVDVPGWTDVEKKAETLESSFMTPSVTWDSAEKARQIITAALPDLHTDSPAMLTSFRSSVDSASKQQAVFEKDCR